MDFGEVFVYPRSFSWAFMAFRDVSGSFQGDSVGFTRSPWCSWGIFRGVSADLMECRRTSKLDQECWEWGEIILEDFQAFRNASWCFRQSLVFLESFIKVWKRSMAHWYMLPFRFAGTLRMLLIGELRDKFVKKLITFWWDSNLRLGITRPALKPTNPLNRKWFYGKQSQVDSKPIPWTVQYIWVDFRRFRSVSVKFIESLRGSQWSFLRGLYRFQAFQGISWGLQKKFPGVWRGTSDGFQGTARDSRL